MATPARQVTTHVARKVTQPAASGPVQPLREVAQFRCEKIHNLQEAFISLGLIELVLRNFKIRKGLTPRDPWRSLYMRGFLLVPSVITDQEVSSPTCNLASFTKQRGTPEGKSTLVVTVSRSMASP